MPDQTVAVSVQRQYNAPPEKVFRAFTDPHAGIDMLVSVVLAADRAGTALRIKHEMFPDPETRDRHDDGWRATLDRLPEALA
jgi:uncharacterized protein YndB with AHSA1/START domain